MDASITMYPEKKDVIKTYVSVMDNPEYDSCSISLGDISLYFHFNRRAYSTDRMTFGEFADQMNIAIEKIFDARDEKRRALEEAKEEEESNE